MSTINPAAPTTDHGRSRWRSRIDSALRTALACAIIGVTTLYTPPTIRNLLKFPSFAYVTAIIIVGEATLGESLRGAACALCGTVLGALPALLSLYMVERVKLSAATTAVAVAISAFAVALSDARLITKRVALGQIVLVYVSAFKEAAGAGNGRPVLHPGPVAASTALGAVASVLALVLPYPKLAYWEVREKSKIYTEKTKDRMKHLVTAFCAENSSCMAASMSQAKSLTAACTKLLHSINHMQGSMNWERPSFKFLPPPHFRAQLERSQATETPLKGMEIALASTTSLPIKLFDQQLIHSLLTLRDHINTNAQENNKMGTEKEIMMDKTLQSLHFVPQNAQDLPPFFFLFCVKLLFDRMPSTPSLSSSQENKVMPTTEHLVNSCRESEEPSKSKRKMKGNWVVNLSAKRLVIALKCAISLGLAVLFGILFSRDNGYWSGLTVAIAFTPKRESTFKLASIRAHGTALGTVYGVLGSFISQNLMEFRLLALLPWIVFTSFLQRSKTYGQLGAVAATISAMIILGRKYFGSPRIFAIDRLTETYIGLGCFIFVELLLQPKRASTLARTKLSANLRTLRECFDLAASPAELKEKEKELRKRVNELKKCVAEAEVEPNFWFLPFPTACYNKLHGSLCKMVDLMLFLACGMEILDQEVQKGIEKSMKGNVDQFKGLVGASVQCFEEVLQVKPKDLKTSCNDIELGKEQPSSCRNGAIISPDEEQCEKIVSSFLRLSREVMERSEDCRRDLVLCVATVGFCIEGLMAEVREMEKGILELMQWENPSTYINLYEICSRVKEIAT